MPPNPVTCVVRSFASKFSFKSSRIKSTISESVGFSSTLSSTIAEFKAIFTSAALPSSEGIAWIGKPATKYELSGLPDSGNTLFPIPSR